MNKTCFVPDCSATAGVLFPKNVDIKLQWLKALGLEHTCPNPRSFICLDHFQPNGQPASKFKAFERKSSKIVKLEETFASKSGPVSGASKLVSTKSTEQQDEKEPKKLQDSKAHPKFDKMCRLCMVESFEVTENVYNKIDGTRTIAEVIGICLYPLKVLPNDKHSKKVCTNCLQFLKEYFDFYEMCVEMDAIQCNLLEKCSDEDSTNSAYSSEEEYLHEERLSDYEQDAKEIKEDQSNNGQKVVNGHVDEENSKVPKDKYDKEKDDLLKVLEGKEDIELTKIDNADNIEPTSIVVQSKSPNKKFASVEDQLCEMANETMEKVKSITKHKSFDSNNEISNNVDENFSETEFAKTDSEEFTENIIIEMVVEEETNEPSTSKLPNSSNSKSIKRKRSDDSSIGVKKLTLKNETVTLPSCIKLEVKKPYRSALGTFKSERIQYIFDSKYILAAGYLYDLRLMKNNMRRLKCIVNKCPGIARQRLIHSNKFDVNVEVVAAHNHNTPTGMERKKQMFFHILNSKMQSDKNFNFHLFYERTCELDKNISQILPLRQVVNTICKQAPTPLPPLLRSFNDFYTFIENDEFYRIHFTSNHVQFYQTKCESEDGGKAVIFGNLDVINDFSHSNLMYVDSSFVIDSQDFAYQLVTVLLWINETFYPIFYAIINMRSLEIYNKIFTILYNDIAPKLRPAEIVTDYEANLYYALGYTYMESSIGGSIFYFTQNIYKRLCLLNLARELEINTNLRVIYNMILMLPLLPEEDIVDGLKNIEKQAAQLDVEHLTKDLFRQIYEEWIKKVTPALFCVYRLDSRIDENIVAPFKKLRDLIMLSKPKGAKTLPAPSILTIIEKLLDLEKHVRETYASSSQTNLFKDVSSSQKKMILKGWIYWENDPRRNINDFYMKILGYIKCMENQLWIWGFYRFNVIELDVLIDANNFTPPIDEDVKIQYEPESEDQTHYLAAYDEDVKIQYAPEVGDQAIEETFGNTLEHHEHVGSIPEQVEEKLEEKYDEAQEIIEEYYIEEGGEVRKITNEQYTSNFMEELTDEFGAAQQLEPEIEEKPEAAGGSDQNIESLYNFMY